MSPSDKRKGVDGTGGHTLGRVAVLADRDVELVPGHVLGDDQAGQAQAALPIVVKRAGQRTALAIAAEFRLYEDFLCRHR